MKIGAGNRRNSSPVEAVHRLRTVAVDHKRHSLSRMVEYIGELLLFLLRFIYAALNADASWMMPGMSRRSCRAGSAG